MTEWITTLTTWLDMLDPDQQRLLFSVLLGGAVFGLMLMLYLIFGGLFDPVRKRADSLKETAKQSAKREELSKSSIGALGDLVAPKEAAKRGRTEALLRHANFRQQGSLRVFYGLKLSAALLIPGLTWITLQLFSPTTPTDALLRYLVAGMILGYILPDLVLRQLVKRLQERLSKGLPDAMDLLVVCAEAGLGLGAAIQRVASELNISHPELADELALFSMQTRAGMDTRGALKDLEDRTGLEDVQMLVAMLLQSMRFGTSIADTLRICAEDLRDKRLQRAQEKAARISTLMLFPLITCIMPSFLVVLIGPAILGIAEALSKTWLAG